MRPSCAPRAPPVARPACGVRVERPPCAPRAFAGDDSRFGLRSSNRPSPSSKSSTSAGSGSPRRSRRASTRFTRCMTSCTAASSEPSRVSTSSRAVMRTPNRSRRRRRCRSIGPNSARCTDSPASEIRSFGMAGVYPPTPSVGHPAVRCLRRARLIPPGEPTRRRPGLPTATSPPCPSRRPSRESARWSLSRRVGASSRST